MDKNFDNEVGEGKIYSHNATAENKTSTYDKDTFLTFKDVGIWSIMQEH